MLQFRARHMQTQLQDVQENHLLQSGKGIELVEVMRGVHKSL